MYSVYYYTMHIAHAIYLPISCLMKKAYATEFRDAEASCFSCQTGRAYLLVGGESKSGASAAWHSVSSCSKRRVRDKLR